MVEGVTVIGDVRCPDGRGHVMGVVRVTIWLEAIERQVRRAWRRRVDVAAINAVAGLRDWRDRRRERKPGR